MAIALLSHPNIVKIFDVGFNEQELQYIVMEYIDGIYFKYRVPGVEMNIQILRAFSARERGLCPQRYKVAERNGTPTHNQGHGFRHC